MVTSLKYEILVPYRYYTPRESNRRFVDLGGTHLSSRKGGTITGSVATMASPVASRLSTAAITLDGKVTGIFSILKELAYLLGLRLEDFNDFLPFLLTEDRAKTPKQKLGIFSSSSSYRLLTLDSNRLSARGD